MALAEWDKPKREGGKKKLHTDRLPRKYGFKIEKGH